MHALKPTPWDDKCDFDEKREIPQADRFSRRFANLANGVTPVRSIIGYKENEHWKQNHGLFHAFAQTFRAARV